MILGKWGEGSTVLLTTVSTLAGLFILGRRRQTTELRQKSAEAFAPDKHLSRPDDNPISVAIPVAEATLWLA